jgi:hypothetical protein
MSNFAATSIPSLGRLSPADDGTSKIIDAFSNINYVILEVSVGFRICDTGPNFVAAGTEPGALLLSFYAISGALHGSV